MKKGYLLILCAALGISATSLTFITAADGYGRLLAETETVITHIGDVVDIESRSLSYNGVTKAAKAQVFDPDGYPYGGHSFTCNKNGLYRVTYTAYFDTIEVSESVEYICQRRSQDLFITTDSVTSSCGNYRYNTKKSTIKGAVFDLRVNSSVTFDSILDPTTFDKNTPLIDFIIDPSSPGTADFENLTVRIANAEDESDYVDVLFTDSGLVDTDGQGTYIRAGFAGGVMAGYESGVGWHKTSYGCSAWSSFRALPEGNSARSMKIYFDYSDRSLWVNPQLFGTGTLLINDLDGTAIYPSNPWQGFKSNKVKVSLIPSNFKTGSGRVVVQSVLGYDLTPLEIEDHTAPTISIDYAGQSLYNLPKAKVGSPYKIYDAIVKDALDKDLKATVSVTRYDATNKCDIDVNVKDGYFTPTKEGTYKILYTASDRSGNVATPKTLTINAVSSLNKLGISYDKSSVSTSILSEVNIPSIKDLTVNNANGQVSVERSVYSPSNELLDVGGTSFVPTEVGDYHVIFEAFDYLGSYASFIFTIRVVALDKPILYSEETPYPCLINGFNYVPKTYKAYETVDNKLKELIPSITMNGDDVTNGFVASGDKVTLTYTASGASGTSEEKVTIPVVDGDDTRNQAAYFYGGMSATMEEEYISLKTTSNASTVFANALCTSDLSIYFSIDESASNYSEIDFVMTDTINANHQLTFRFYIKDDGSYSFSLPNKSPIDFPILSNEFRILYQNKNHRVTAIDGSSLGTVTTFDNGDAFTGFSNTCYLSINTKGVTGEAGVFITKINNQLFGLKGEQYEDHYEIASPVIVYDEELKVEQGINNSFAYPTFHAYDVLSQIKETTIRVIAPDGTQLLKTSGQSKESFAITQYGKYTLNYIATDTSNNTCRYAKAVYIYDDVAPEFTVNGSVNSSYKVGGSVKIPTYTVKDNSDTVTVDVIVVLPNAENRILTRDVNGEVTYYLTNDQLYSSSFIVDKTHFRVELKGEYELRFIAYDNDYNSVVVSQKFIAK